MRQRRYHSHRRAYGPRLWPQTLAAYVLAMVPFFAFGWRSPWLACLSALVAGLVVSRVWWAVWRRRHPVISPQELADDYRRAARWN